MTDELSSTGPQPGPGVTGWLNALLGDLQTSRAAGMPDLPAAFAANADEAPPLEIAPRAPALPTAVPQPAAEPAPTDSAAHARPAEPADDPGTVTPTVMSVVDLEVSVGTRTPSVLEKITLNFFGLPPGVALTVGRADADGCWQVPALSLMRLAVVMPRDMQQFDMEVEMITEGTAGQRTEVRVTNDEADRARDTSIVLGFAPPDTPSPVRLKVFADGVALSDLLIGWSAGEAAPVELQVPIDTERGFPFEVVIRYAALNGAVCPSPKFLGADIDGKIVTPDSPWISARNVGADRRALAWQGDLIMDVRRILSDAVPPPRLAAPPVAKARAEPDYSVADQPHSVWSPAEPIIPTVADRPSLDHARAPTPDVPSSPPASVEDMVPPAPVEDVNMVPPTPVPSLQAEATEDRDAEAPAIAPDMPVDATEPSPPEILADDGDVPDIDAAPDVGEAADDLDDPAEQADETTTMIVVATHDDIHSPAFLTELRHLGAFIRNRDNPDDGQVYERLGIDIGAWRDIRAYGPFGAPIDMTPPLPSLAPPAGVDNCRSYLKLAPYMDAAKNFSTIIITGLPHGSLVTQGINLGGGRWSLTAEEARVAAVLGPLSGRDAMLTDVYVGNPGQQGAMEGHRIGSLWMGSIADRLRPARQGMRTIRYTLGADDFDPKSYGRLTVTIGDMPPGTLIDGAVNHGDGVWTLEARTGAALSLTVADFTKPFTMTLTCVALNTDSGDSSVVTKRLSVTPRSGTIRKVTQAAA